MPLGNQVRTKAHMNRDNRGGRVLIKKFRVVWPIYELLF
jgi:hypothetical protein